MSMQAKMLCSIKFPTVYTCVCMYTSTFLYSTCVNLYNSCQIRIQS